MWQAAASSFEVAATWKLLIYTSTHTHTRTHTHTHAHSASTWRFSACSVAYYNHTSTVNISLPHRQLCCINFVASLPLALPLPRPLLAACCCCVGNLRFGRLDCSKFCVIWKLWWISCVTLPRHFKIVKRQRKKAAQMETHTHTHTQTQRDTL